MMLSEIVKFVFRSAGRGMNQNIGIMRKKEDSLVAYPGESHGSGTSPEEKGALYWLVLKRPAGEADYLGLGGEESVELFRCLESQGPAT